MINLEKAQGLLSFNEKNLIESSRVLLDAHRDKTNVFSTEIEECHTILPKGVTRGSKEHASFVFFISIVDKIVDGDTVFRRGRSLFEKNPEVFDAKHVFETDRDKLKIVKRKDSTQMLVAPTIGEIIKTELKHGLWKPLSGDWYRSARKLAMVFDSDPRKPFDCVKNFSVALERLDSGKPSQPIKKEIKQLTFPRFRGFGEAKVAPLLIMWFRESGFIEGMARQEILVPFDTHALNFTIGREIAKPNIYMRTNTFAKYAQALFSRTFKQQKVDPIKFHAAQWRLGSNVCSFADCHSLKTEKGEMLCPYSTPCREFLDKEKYRMGVVTSTKGNLFAQ